MKRKKRLRQKTLIFLSILCLLSMALPSISTSWHDARLLKTDIPRPVSAELPSEQAQEIPVLYALYRKRYLSGIQMDAPHTSADAAEQALILSAKAEELKNSGVLSEECLQKVKEIFLQSSPAAYYQEQDGFIGGTYLAYSDITHDMVKSVTVQWHQKTGLVTSCSVTVSLVRKDADVFLNAYRTYLGLDVLADWETIDTGGASAACWSKSGQIYLYYTFQDDRLSFGAISLSAEEFDFSFSKSF